MAPRLDEQICCVRLGDTAVFDSRLVDIQMAAKGQRTTLAVRPAVQCLLSTGGLDGVAEEGLYVAL